MTGLEYGVAILRSSYNITYAGVLIEPPVTTCRGTQ